MKNIYMHIFKKIKGKFLKNIIFAIFYLTDKPVFEKISYTEVKIHTL